MAFKWKTLLEPEWLVVEVLGLAGLSFILFEYEKMKATAAANAAATTARRKAAWQCVLQNYFQVAPFQPSATWAAANNVTLPIYDYDSAVSGGIDQGQFEACGYTASEAAYLATIYTGPHDTPNPIDTSDPILQIAGLIPGGGLLVKGAEELYGDKYGTTSS
jgi:hypothetical protein